MSLKNIAISIRGLSKSYIIGKSAVRHNTFAEAMVDRLLHPFQKSPKETFWALKDVSFDVAKGDIVGIIGRNGAGKSTLLKILSRITVPTSGEIDVYGRIGSLLEVGTGFHPELTGRENIYLNGAILGMSRREIDKQFDAIVDFSGTERFLDTPVKRYSSGMYVRLAFAVAAQLNTEILIVDEVLAVGDIDFQKKCLGKMQDVASHGRTVLFVSHNLGSLQQLTRSAILLQNGQVLTHGVTSDVIESYLTVSMDSSMSVYDVSTTTRNHDLNRCIEFLTLELDNSTTGMIAADQDFRFRIMFRAHNTVARFRISMTIFRLDGTAVGSFFGDDSLSIMNGEECAFLVCMSDLRLAPGHYCCALSVGIGNNLEGFEDFDRVHDVLHFQILAEAGTEGTVSAWSSTWGSIRFKPPVVTRVETK